MQTRYLLIICCIDTHTRKIIFEGTSKVIRS